MNSLCKGCTAVVLGGVEEKKKLFFQKKELGYYEIVGNKDVAQLPCPPCLGHRLGCTPATLAIGVHRNFQVK